MNVQLPSGRQVDFDLNRVTLREFRSLFIDSTPQEEEDAVLAKAFGLTANDLLDTSQPDYRAMVKTFFDAARGPLDDPKA